MALVMDRAGLTLLQAPAAEPLSLADAKTHLRVDGDDEDALISALIVAARNHAESITGRALVTQRRRLTLPAFPAGEDLSIELPKPALQSVQSVTYLDGDGVRQTLAGHQVVTDELVGRVLPAYGAVWPACRETPGSVVIDYTAGYGDAYAVPEGIKAWLRLAIGAMYEQRAAMSDKQAYELPGGFWQSLLWGYTVPRGAY